MEACNWTFVHWNPIRRSAQVCIKHVAKPWSKGSCPIRKQVELKHVANLLQSFAQTEKTCYPVSFRVTRECDPHMLVSRYQAPCMPNLSMLQNRLVP